MRAYVPVPDATIVETASTPLACLSWGPDDGPLVILVHGFPDTAQSWDEVGPRLAAEGFRVVAPYTRGYAPSPVPRDDRYDSDTLGMDIIHLLDALEAPSAILVGHDWGASAVYSATGLHPERVEKMVAAAIPHPAAVKPSLSLLWGVRHFLTFKLPGAAARFAKDDFAQVRTMYERWSPTHSWPEAEFEAVKNSFSAPGALQAALNYYRDLSPIMAPGIKARIQVPSLLIGGVDDGVATEALYQQSRRRFDGPFEVAMLPGGHFLHREHPEPFLKALLAFLKGATV